MIFTDQLHRKLELPSPPKRIISLVPSQSELLWDLGLRDELVGITKFCIHPEEMFRSVTRVGGTKQINFEKIAELKPDLIIGNKEENEKEQIEELMKHYPVWISDIKTLDEAIEMMHHIGELTDRAKKANEITQNILNNFKQLPTVNCQLPTLYVIWNNPIMLAGKDTFIDHLLEKCGFKNCCGPTNSRYPVMELHELSKLAPELILLSSEPYPFKEKHIAEFKAVCPDAKVILADGEFFSWYGSRLLKAPAYFSRLMQELGL